jgi:hypothetical protein
MSHEPADEFDPIVEGHLEEARVNREKNMIKLNQALHQYESSSKDKAINIGELLGKLNEAKTQIDGA